ncbi:MAG: S41 family peptidase [Anaerolineales bacterium]|jgi:carboxyl-terminal processing protease
MKKLTPMIGIRIIAIILCLVMLSNCQQQAQIKPPETIEMLSPIEVSIETPTQGINYLSEVIEIIETNALNRDQVDWKALKMEVLEREKSATMPSDTYDSIQYLLLKLNDKHSFFWLPEQAQEFKKQAAEFSTEPWGEIYDGKIAYIWNGVFASGNQDVIDQYADDLQQVVIELDAQNPCAWVVDLRDNSGGTVFPMLAGLGELFRDGVAAMATDSYDHIIEFTYKNGMLWEDGILRAQTTHLDFGLSTPALEIVVLIGPQTASSGEMTALAFEGLPNVTFFGHPTAGLTTANETYELSDGAMLFLTTAVFGDRTGKKYGGAIEPDYSLENPDGGKGTIPGEVFDWLGETSSCGNQ